MKKTLTTKFKIDEDVQGVLQFMQDNVPANKRFHVVESLPHIAKVLWTRAHYQKADDFSAVTLEPNLEHDPKAY